MTNAFKKAAWISALACVLPTSAIADVIITEYVEGGGSNKAIEITNLGDTAVDLGAEQYKLTLYTNGKTEEQSNLPLTGTLAPNASYVIYNAQATAEFVFAELNSTVSDVTNFNGDDAIVLTKAGTVVDSFGRVGEDPGKKWTDPNNPDFSTQDKTLRRKATVTSGDTTEDDAFPGDNNEWVAFAKDTADGLGCAGEAACENTGPDTQPGEIDNGETDSGADTGTDSATGDDTQQQTALCLNCPAISKIADASTYHFVDYYAAAVAAEPAELKAELNKIASANHKQLSYSEVWSVLTYSDQDPANPDNVIEIYTGNSVAKSSNGSGAQANAPGAWNREHIWPKSHGFPERNQFAHTDAHHLRPADVSVNSTRSNYDFAVGGTPVDEATGNLVDTTKGTFEPRDEVKGDVARMAFYMDLRYNGAATDNTPDLKLVTKINTANGDPELGNLCTLYQWHLIDQVDDFEKNRNNVVYEYQGNRNPFIDNPDWVEALYGTACDTSTAPDSGNESGESEASSESNSAPVITIDGAMTVAEGATVTIDASGSTDAEGDALTYHWKQLTSELIYFDVNAATLTFEAPGVDADTPIKFELTLSDGKETVTETFIMVVENNDGGGSMGWLIVGLMAAAVRVRRMSKR